MQNKVIRRLLFTWEGTFQLLGRDSVLCCVQSLQLCLFVTLWTVALQATLSMGFSRQEYQSELPCPPQGDLPDPGSKPLSPVSPALQADSLPTVPKIRLDRGKILKIMKIHSLFKVFDNEGKIERNVTPAQEDMFCGAGLPLFVGMFKERV